MTIGDKFLKRHCPGSEETTGLPSSVICETARMETFLRKLQSDSDLRQPVEFLDTIMDRGRKPPRHFSMIRGFHLADFFTLANAACGIAAVFFAMLFVATQARQYFFAAAAMAPAAFVFDVLDGMVARWRHEHSPLGRELDSLADVISFGVAPATLAFAAGLHGGWDWLALIYFVCCGVSRLARFNVTAEDLSQGGAKVAYFEGTPIPTSVLLTAVLAFAGWQDRLGDSLYGGTWMIGPWALHPFALLFVLSGSMMISKTLKIPKL